MVLAQEASSSHQTQSNDVSQLECRTRSVMQGLATGTITFVAFYFTQRAFAKSAKGMNVGVILGSSLFMGALSGYLITDAKLKECNSANKKTHTFGKLKA